MAVSTAVMTEEMTGTEQELYDVDYYTHKTYDAFYKFDVEGEYTSYGIKQNVQEWLDNKWELMELLRKHPNWNEEAKAVILHKKETRMAPNDTIEDLCNDIVNLQSWNELRIEYSKPVGDHMCKLITYSFSQYVDEDLYNFFNENYPELHIHQGSKTSRALNKFFTYYKYNEIPEYNRLYAQLADALNPLVVEKTSILSVNFLDYMLMSHGNSWSSCHSILPHGAYNGCYKAGCASYATDNISMIYYTISNDYDGNDYCLEEKITRQVFMYKDGTLVQDRLYPQCNDGDTGKSDTSLVKQYRTIVESIIATCLDKPNLWHKAEAMITQNNHTYMYDDWFQFPNWIYAINSEDGTENVGTITAFGVGGPSYCFDCGQERTDDNSEYLYGECCIQNTHCEDCGRDLDEEDLHYCESADQYLCDDCCFYCEYHERYEPKDELYCYVTDYGDICEDAYIRGEFAYCNECGQYYFMEDCCYLENNDVLCKWCFDKIGGECADCGELYYLKDLVWDAETGDYYCEECAKEHIHENDNSDNENNENDGNSNNNEQVTDINILPNALVSPENCVKLLSSTDIQYAVNCRTEKDAELFLEMCDEAGYRWASGFSLTEWTNWENYKQDTVYMRESECTKKHICYGDLAYTNRDKYTVLTFYVTPAYEQPSSAA